MPCQAVPASQAAPIEGREALTHDTQDVDAVPPHIPSPALLDPHLLQARPDTLVRLDRLRTLDLPACGQAERVASNWLACRKDCSEHAAASVSREDRHDDLEPLKGRDDCPRGCACKTAGHKKLHQVLITRRDA